jgi:hypothetical protein
MKVVVEISYNGKCENCMFSQKYSNSYQWHPEHENMFVCRAFYNKSIGTRGELKRLERCIEAQIQEGRE